MFEGDFLFDFFLTLLLQVFSKKYFCKQNIFKIARPVLAALRVNRLSRLLMVSRELPGMQNKISVSSPRFPIGLSVSKASKTALHNNLHLYSDLANLLMTYSGMVKCERI